MARRVPRSIVVVTVLALVVAAGAVSWAGVIRWRADAAETGAPTSGNPSTTSAVGVGGCLREPCVSLATTTVGGTGVELVADAGLTSGRLRIGGVGSGQVIESTVSGRGITLGPESLQCQPGGPAACMIKGRHADGSSEEVAGQVVVGRSGTWSSIERLFLSDAGYLALGRVNGDNAPEVLAAQHECPGGAAAGCADTPVFVQVFTFAGEVVGCTKSYAKLGKLPGYPAVTITAAELSPCGQAPTAR